MADRSAAASAKLRKKPKRKRYVWRLVLLLLVLWLGADLYLSNFVPQVTRTEITLPRLPGGFAGYRVAHVSDLHAKSFGRGSNTLLTLLEREQPDIIAITGDLIDETSQLEWAESLLGRLMEIAPVYYVTGNHEWGGDYKAAREGRERLVPKLREIVKAQGAEWMDNTFLTIGRGGDTIVLAGLTDPNGPRDQQAIGPLVARIRKTGDPFILTLSHRYDRLEEYAENGLDLVLSGHAHGGVIRLPFTEGLVGPGHDFLPKHTGGVYQLGGTVMSVSRGLGDTGVPRLGNRPEISILTLVKGNVP